MVSEQQELDTQQGAGHDARGTESPATATFKGRLHLKDFMFSSPEPTQLRRSPRLLRHTSTVTVSETVTSSRTSSATISSTSSSLAKTTIVTRSSPGSKPPRAKPQTPASPSPSPSSSSASSPRKRKRQSSSYAPPSTYAHLPPLRDAIAPNLLVLFVGLNPGIQTARSGHAYAHPSNLFWKLLFSSGITPRPCTPQEDQLMPELFGTGHTNIVGRPSRNGAELSRQEMDDGVAVLEEKIRRWKPETACIVGKSIWESIWRVRHGGRAVGADFKYGWQDETENMGLDDDDPGWKGARVFVASSTSGLAASLSRAEKQAIWNELGAFVKKRRAERALEGEKPEENGQKPEENGVPAPTPP
ncbi:G/U mismatch-specific uracil DNA glycosylase-like protein [Hapsidospora chrysogenum ATCC 11550]|uniref:G/U mismatch-specific uracil DNA glycosylase-like protein n=1 Tax=Hapsidospora chrysogenum (strain ATCC 11550 / CBS 779.69 / DSM 880 / IAM 14645 / JCM 23072 / IMI 49137) TaxID=857340 RepID=A0A086SU93_HAPC1|nr:G/U mismatch-specific uracil DNA glycosylase-like protein [Hapsidospora chrysogenum ATCC 11550]